MKYTNHQLILIAEAVHEANRLYCLSLGDTSQPLWGHAPAWQRESAVKGVQVVADLIEQAQKDGVTLKRTAVGEILHQSWMDEKTADGWVYGETKDAGAKTHPCMVPYAKLPRGQRTKDKLFFDTARILLEGFRRVQVRLDDSVRYGQRISQAAQQ